MFFIKNPVIKNKEIDKNAHMMPITMLEHMFEVVNLLSAIYEPTPLREADTKDTVIVMYIYIFGIIMDSLITIS